MYLNKINNFFICLFFLLCSVITNAETFPLSRCEGGVRPAPPEWGAAAQVGCVEYVENHTQLSGVVACGYPSHAESGSWATGSVEATFTTTSGNPATVTDTWILAACYCPPNSTISGEGCQCNDPFVWDGSACRLKDDPQPCTPQTPNPVTLSRGEKHYHFKDFLGNSLFPLQIERAYQVRIGKIQGSVRKKASWFWTSFDKRLVVADSDDIRIRLGSGRGMLNFALVAGIWESQDEGLYNQLEPIESGGMQIGWRLSFGNGSSEEYDMDGYLSKMVAENGLSHGFSYTTTNGFVTELDIEDDQTQQTLRIYLEVEQPVKVVILDSPSQSETGRPTIEYVWDTDMQLQAVIYPDDDSDPDNNPVQVYEYNTTANNGIKGLITGYFEVNKSEYDDYVADPTNNPLPETKRYSKVAYDSLGRVTGSALWDGTQKVEELTFQYKLTDGTTDWDWSSNTTTPTTIVTNSEGLSTTYSFQTSTALNASNTANDWRLVSVDGDADLASGCAATSAQTTYSISTDTEGAGYLKTTTDNSGSVVTKRTRDSYGRVVTFETGLNSSEQPTAVSQKTTTTYRSGDETTIPESKTYSGRNAGNTAWVDYSSVDFTYDSNNRLIQRDVTDELNSVTRSWAYTNTYYSGTTVPSSIVIDGPVSGTGDLTTYNYNSSGQLTSIVNALSQTTSYSNYNGFGLPGTITDANGVVTTITYDARGRVDVITSDDGGTEEVDTDFDYYPNGLLQKTTQAKSVTGVETSVEYFYNSAHQLTGIQNNFCDYIEYTPSVLDGKWTEQKIYGDGTLTSGVCGSGTLAADYKRVFDALGRLSKIKDASGVEKQVLGYDTNNNLTTRILKGDGETTVTDYDANDIAYEMEYDALNRLVTAVTPYACNDNDCVDTYNNADETPTSPAPPETTYAYNGQGLVSSVTAANGVVTGYSYNGFGELIEEDSPDRGITSYTYGGAGRLLSKTIADGTADEKSTCYQYDNLNRLTGIDYNCGGTFGTADIAYTYDQNDSAHGEGIGRLTSVTDLSGVTNYKYDALGRVVKQTVSPTSTSLSFDTLYSYNKAGQLIQTTEANGLVIDHNRTGGRLTDVDLSVAGVGTLLSDMLTSPSYLPFGGLIGHSRLLYSSETLDRLQTFNANGQLTGISNTLDIGSETYSLDRSYSYDAYGNIATIGSTNDPLIGEAYVYDQQQRLKEATGIYGHYVYDYDDVGNRQSLQVSRPDVDDTGYDPSNPATWVYQNIFKDVYTYDYEGAGDSNRLLSVDRNQGDGTGNDVSQRTLKYDNAGNTVIDRRKTLETDGTTVKSHIARDADYDDANRMDAVTPVDCASSPTDPACL